MKPIITPSSTTIFVPNVKEDLSKLQQNKGIIIRERGSSSQTAKPVTTNDPKDKGKGVHVEPLEEEKKNLQELEMEILRQLTL